MKQEFVYTEQNILRKETLRPIDKEFLKSFYLEVYDRLRKYLPGEKVVVHHDGFELMT